MSEAEKKILARLLANNQRALKRLYARAERLKNKKKFSISFVS